MANGKIQIMVYRHSAFYAPLIGCVTAGFLRNADIDAAYFQKPPDRNLYQMFRNGDVQVMQAAVSTSWDPLSKGIPDIPRHFAQINQRDGFFLVGRRPDEKFRWSRLEGARLLADHAQQPLAMLRFAAHLERVAWERIVLVNAGSPESMAGAFRRGDCDYVHLQGAAAQQLEVDGIGHVVASVGESIPPIAFSSLMAMPEFLASAEARSFMYAYRQSLAWANEADVADVVAALHTQFDAVSPAALRSAIERYRALGTWRRDPEIPRDQYELAMDAFIHAGVFNRRFSYDDVVVPPPA